MAGKIPRAQSGTQAATRTPARGAAGPASASAPARSSTSTVPARNARPRKRPEDVDQDAPEGIDQDAQGDVDEDAQEDSYRAPRRPMSVPDAVNDGAGVLLGALVWCWLVLPYLRGGLPEMRKVLKAKFLNKAPDGTWLP